MKYYSQNILLTVLLAFCCLLGCYVPQAWAGAPDDGVHLATGLPAGKYATLEELQGKKIGVRPGSIQEKYILENIKDPDLQHFANFTDMALALSQEKIDAFSLSKISFDKLVQQYPQLTCLDKPLVMAPYYIALCKNPQGEQLRTQLNAYLAKLRATGQDREMKARWYGGDYAQYDLKYAELPDTNGTLILASPAIAEPYAFVYNNTITGLDIEIITGFCREYGYRLQIETADWGGALSGLETGKYQLAACSLAKSAEREKHAYFSEPYEYAPVAVIVQARQEATAGSGSFLSSLRERFNATFWAEDRWKLFANGAAVTIILSVASIVLGSLLGFVLCLWEMSRSRLVSRAARLFVRFNQGIPLVLLLLMLYYIVFASVRINGVLVGVIGFTLLFAAYAAEIFRSGILAVDAGQLEAARALGLGKWQSFFKVVFPQALHNNLPVYKSEVITIIKATSVAGYIAINDLTKVSDIVRSRTFDAFFPLAAAAIFYFLLSYAAIKIVDRAFARFDPQQRKNFLADINTATAPAAAGPLPSAAARPGATILTVSHLRKKFGNAEPLKDVSFTVATGDVVSIIGPSGTGKSTLLRCLNQLTKADGGSIIFQNQELNAATPAAAALRRKIGMVFQSFNLFPHLTIVENIMLAPVTVHKLPRRQAYERAMSLLAGVGLQDKALNYPEELSGGQQQRVSIARALAMQPEILLLDEPTSALDPTMVGEVMQILRQLAQQGTTMLLVTHEMKLAKNLSTQVLYLDEGIVYESGTAEQIFQHPQQPQTRRFLREQKQFALTINTQDFALPEIIAAASAFAHANFLAAGYFYHLQLLLEEILVNGFAAYGPECFPLRLVLDITANEDVYVQFDYPGQRDILAGLDELSAKVMQCAYSESKFVPGTEGSRLVLHIQ